MKVTRHTLRQIIREELLRSNRRALLESDVEESFDLDGLAAIFEAYMKTAGSHKFTPYKIQYQVQIYKDATDIQSLHPVIDIMGEILTKASKMPDVEPFNVKSYYRLLLDEIPALSHYGVSKDLFDVEGSEDLDFIFQSLKYFYRLPPLDERGRINVDTIRRFLRSFNNIKANPSLIQNCLALPGTIPKFRMLFRYPQNHWDWATQKMVPTSEPVPEEYKVKIAEMINSRDIANILHAAELADMVAT